MNAKSTWNESTINSASQQGNVLRQWGCLALLIVAALFVLLGAWTLTRFTLPPIDRVNAGPAGDYLPDQEPRLFWLEGTPFYVLNVDGGLIALRAVSTRPGYCRINWDEQRQRFVDPCWGTRFLRSGEYDINSGPPQDMEHLPLEVEDGEVWVDIGY